MQDVAARFREYIQLERRRDVEDLAPAEFEHWTRLKRFLGRRFNPELSDERADQRRSVRVPTRLTVTFRDDHQLRSSQMTNLSRGGLFIATERPREIGAILELRIDVKETGEQIEVPAEVVSLGPDSPRSRRGMGLRFRPTSEAMQRQLDVLYERQLKEAAIRWADGSSQSPE